MTQPYGQQPGQPQPQYGQPIAGQYGPPEGAYGRPPGQLTFGVVGTVLAAVGAASGVVAFTAVDWYTLGAKDSSSHYGEVKKVLDQLGGTASGISKLYFGWLGWALLAVAFVVAVLANMPSSSAGPLRALGVIIAVASIAITFWALKFLSTSSPGYSHYLDHARIGFYLALAAFLLIGIGAMIGPRRQV